MPPVQWTPHAPQWFELVRVSAQAPPQFVSPGAHEAWHTPELHTCPGAHGEAQAPQ